MNKTDLPFLSVAELSRLIASKEVSPLEVTQAYLERIDELDFKFNSYLTVCREEALRAAGEAERQIAQGNYLGPMHGIPVAVKDQLWTKGIRSTGGSRILADFIPQEDATAIAKLKTSGAILLGKTNLSEFAVTGFSHRFQYSTQSLEPGHVCWRFQQRLGGRHRRFPLRHLLRGGYRRLDSTPRRLVWLGWAASYLGPGEPAWRDDWCLVYGHVGPISRTVEDAAITLRAIAGHDPKDPYTWNTPVPDYRQYLDGNIRGMRVGIVNELMDSEWVEPEVREATGKSGLRVVGTGSVGDGGVYTPDRSRQRYFVVAAGRGAGAKPAGVGQTSSSRLRTRQPYRAVDRQSYPGSSLTTKLRNSGLCCGGRCMKPCKPMMCWCRPLPGGLPVPIRDDVVITSKDGSARFTLHADQQFQPSRRSRHIGALRL